MRANGGATGRRPRARSGTPGSSVTSRTADTPFSGGGACAGAVMTSTGGGAVAAAAAPLPMPPASRSPAERRLAARPSTGGAASDRRTAPQPWRTRAWGGVGVVACGAGDGGGALGATAAPAGAGCAGWSGRCWSGRSWSRRRRCACRSGLGRWHGAGPARPPGGGRRRGRGRSAREQLGALQTGGLEHDAARLRAAALDEVGFHAERDHRVVRRRGEAPGLERREQRLGPRRPAREQARVGDASVGLERDLGAGRASRARVARRESRCHSLAQLGHAGLAQQPRQRERERDRHGEADAHRLAVDLRRLVLPLPGRRDRRLVESRHAAQHAGRRRPCPARRPRCPGSRSRGCPGRAPPPGRRAGRASSSSGPARPRPRP